MGRSKHGDFSRKMQEAQAACEESARTGAPIDEVAQQRAERRVTQASVAQELAQTYNHAVRRVLERGAPEDQRAKALAAANLRRVGRRELLTGAAALAAAAAFAPRRARAATKNTPRVAIVGGGVAGLRCAHVLWNKYGWGSTVYEGSSQVGGRIETIRGYFNDGLIVEAHGEYISSEHTSMLGLVKLFNLSLDDTRAYAPNTLDTYWVNGARYPWAQFLSDWQSWAWQLFNNAVKTVPWPQSYNAYNATGYQWDQLSVPQWLTQYAPGGLSSNFASMILQSMIDEYGGDPGDQSALNLTMILGYNDSASGRGFQSETTPYIAGTDERWHVTGGNDQVITGIVGQLPSGTIQLGMQLVALATNSDGTYTLTFETGGSTRTVVADTVVLAIPFKILRNVDLSKAGLSPLKTTAINTLGFGTNAKTIMQFNGVPWIKDGFDGTTYQDNGFISSGWQPAQSPAIGGYQSAQSLWLAYPGGNDTQQIINAYNLTTDSGVPSAKMINETLAQLEPVLPGVTAAYNGLAWYEYGLLDPFLQGAYSYWRVGQYTGFSGYEGVQEGRIHFAGEHTSQNFQGFMEGGAESGERCATEVKTTS